MAGYLDMVRQPVDCGDRALFILSGTGGAAGIVTRLDRGAPDGIGEIDVFNKKIKRAGKCLLLMK